MASLERSRHLWSLGLFVLPLLAVKLAAVLFGGVPHPARASGNVPTLGATDPALLDAAARKSEVQWTPRQRAAGEHITRLSGQSFGPTPLLYTSKAAPPAPAPSVPKVTPVAPTPVILPRLRAVMNASGIDKALINDEFYQVGEQIHDTPFKVQSISIDGRSVTLMHVDRTTVTIAVQGP